MIETAITVFTAVGVAFAVMIAVATIVRQILGLPVWVNVGAQTAALYYIGTTFAFFSGIQIPIMVALPVVMFASKYIGDKRMEHKAKTGQYGQETKWAYELFEENDFEFIHAAKNLPNMDKREVEVIADSKQEFRDLMVERYNELADDSLEDTEFFERMNQNN